MNLILSCSFLFILKGGSAQLKCVGKKNFFWEERGQKVKRNTKTEKLAPISLLPFYQWRVRGRTGHAPRTHLKRTVH